MSGSTAVGDRLPALRRPPLWREVLLVVGFLLAYEWVQLFAGHDAAQAVRHAEALLSLERSVGVHPEALLNSALVGWRPGELAAALWYQSLHYTVTPAVLALVWWRLPSQYRRLRTSLLVTTAVALVGYFVFPAAPPRLLLGYTDVVAATADAGWWSDPGPSSAVNQLAAMPSMHVGWALWSALALRRVLTAPWARALALAYPVTTTLVVLATANHWLLDAVVGAAVVVVPWVLLAPPREAVRPAPAAVREGEPVARS